MCESLRRRRLVCEWPPPPRSKRVLLPPARPRLSAPRSAKRPAPRFPAPATATGSRRRIAPTRSRCSRPRTPTGSPSWYRCATAGMLVSAFTFYRGAAAIMAADLGPTPTSGLPVQACGDAHLSNFGAYAAADRNLRPRHQRLRRDPARAVGVGSEAARRPASRSPAATVGSAMRSGREIVLTAARTYREHMRELAELSNLEVWYKRLDGLAGPRGVRAGGQQEGAQGLRSQRRQDAAQGPPARLLEADHPGRRRAADRQRPAGARAVRATSSRASS